MKKKIAKGLMLGAAILAILFAILVCYAALCPSGFLPGTSWNGSAISGKSPEEIVMEKEKELADATVSITEKGQTVLVGNLSDYGCALDTETLVRDLTEAESRQRKNPLSAAFHLVIGSRLRVSSALTIDHARMEEFVRGENLSVERVESQEAEVVFDQESGQYIVSGPVQGNEANDAALASFVEENIRKSWEDGTLGNGLNMEIPDEVYTSKKVSTNISKLEEQCRTKNEDLAAFGLSGMSVTYTFGDQTEPLDTETIQSWMSLDKDGQRHVDEDSLRKYVENLAARYNTWHIDRAFHTTDGEDIVIPASSNEYGYLINQEKECEQLKADILGGQAVTREPVYRSANEYGNPYYLAREGTDDLAGTYVEVSVQAQHLWFYKNGHLITEGDVVTGMPVSGRETTKGCFPLAYKESPSVLKGAGYTQPVTYWMPFFEGEGLHDAAWRSAFGGTIYQYDGSHGCVNMPYSAAEKLFGMIASGTPVIVY